MAADSGGRLDDADSDGRVHQRGDVYYSRRPPASAAPNRCSPVNWGQSAGLLRMLLTESLILAAAAGAISLLDRVGSSAGIVTSFTTEPANYQVRPDWVAFAYLAAATLLAGTVAGLTPALESLRLQLTEPYFATRERIASTASAGSSRVRLVLVTIETALSVVLLVIVGIHRAGQRGSARASGF